MKCCGSKCMKYLLIVFNGLFMIFGNVLIVTACVDLSMIRGFAGMETTGHETDAVLIAVGVLIIVVAAFGCFGAWKESPKLLYVFVGCLILIVLLEISVGITAVLLRPQIEDSMKSNLRVSFNKTKSTREEDIIYSDFWRRIQSNYQCCGVTGPENFQDAYAYPLIAPYSCCSPDGSYSECLTDQSFYRDGCEDKVLTRIHSAGIKVIVCGILFSILEVSGIVLALMLAHSIKTQGKSRDTALVHCYRRREESS